MPFVGVIMSVVWSALAWLLRSVLIKFVVFFAVYFLLVELLPLLTQLMPAGFANITGAANFVPPSVWYFFDVFAVPDGIVLIMGAYSARFVIRRIPFIG